MLIIINTTTLSGTGVTQVAVSFIYECISFAENIYHVFLSKNVAKQIEKEYFPSNFFFYDFNDHPLYGIKGFLVRMKLRKLENLINPDVVFSVFGPACWTPKAKHLTGFANSYYVYPESPFFKRISKRELLRIKLMGQAHRFFLRRNGEYFVCETDDMSLRLAKFLRINSSNIFTVSNTYNKFFELDKMSGQKKLLLKPDSSEFRFLTLASFDIHKNLTVINEVVELLEKKSPNNKAKFVLTIDPLIFDRNFSDKAKLRIINLGRVDIKCCPDLYLSCDAVFLPTLIESFSANYPEAMKMQRPIITSGYSFAKSICGNAALYFDPLNPDDIAEKVLKLINDKELANSLVMNGNERLLLFGTAKDRARKYLEILKLI